MRHGPPGEPAALSYSEQAAWDEFVADPETFFKREAILAAELPPQYPAAAAADLVSAIAARHEILRTGYQAVGGQDVRRVLASYPLPGAWPDQAVPARPDPGGPLSPAHLVRVWLRPGADGGQTLCFGLNEMITDPWSCARLREELRIALEQGVAALPGPAGTYAEYARAERARPLPARTADYWQGQLADLAAVPPALPDDGSGPAGTETAAERILILPDRLTSALRTLCQATRSSPFMVVTALVNMALAAMHGASEVVLATMSSTRPGPLADVHGNFSNVTVLRTPLPADPSFTEVVARTRQAVLGAVRHQPAPFLQLCGLIGVAVPRPPVRVHYLPARAHHYSPALDARPSGATWQEETDFAGWPLDLGFAEDSAHRVAVWANYDPRRFSHATVEKLADTCGQILGTAI